MERRSGGQKSEEVGKEEEGGEKGQAKEGEKGQTEGGEEGRREGRSERREGRRVIEVKRDGVRKGRRE